MWAKVRNRFIAEPGGTIFRAPNFTTHSHENHSTMCKLCFTVLTCTAFVAASCGTQTPNGGTVSGTDSTLPPVESRNANTDYKPAFSGQTRAPGVRTTTLYEGTVLTNDLKNPWGIAVLPDGRLLITEKGGTMRIVTTSGQVG